MKKLLLAIIVVLCYHLSFAQSSNLCDVKPVYHNLSCDQFISDMSKFVVVPENYLVFELSGEVKGRFVIDKSGKIKDIKITDMHQEGLDASIEKYLKQSGKWIPARLKGKKVAYTLDFTLPYDYRRNKDSNRPRYKNGNPFYCGAILAKKIELSKEDASKNRYGDVRVSFVVELDGTLSNLNIVQSPNESLSKAVYAEFEKMEKWEPGMTNGKPRAMAAAVSVRFSPQSKTIIEPRINGDEFGDFLRKSDELSKALSDKNTILPVSIEIFVRSDARVTVTGDCSAVQDLVRRLQSGNWTPGEYAGVKLNIKYSLQLNNNRTYVWRSNVVNNEK